MKVCKQYILHIELLHNRVMHDDNSNKINLFTCTADYNIMSSKIHCGIHKIVLKRFYIFKFH